MKAQKLSILLLFTILSISVQSAPDKEGPEVEDDISDDVTTDSEIEFINNSKTNTNLTKAIDETTVGEESEEFDDYEDNIGLIDRLLNRGPNVRQLPKNSSADNVYLYLTKMVSEKMEKQVKDIMPQIHEYFFTLNELVSEQCFLSLLRLANKAKQYNPRALSLLDSSAKVLTVGLTDGTFTDLGHFDQCLRIEEPNTVEYPLIGKYCLVRIRAPLPPPKANLRYSDRFIDFRNTSLENTSLDYTLSSAHSLYSNPFLFGVCVPSECDANDVYKIFNNSLEKYHFEVDVINDCYIERHEKLSIRTLIKRLDFYSAISLIIIGIMCTIVGLATISEFFYNLVFGSDNSTEKPTILEFSLISNVKNLISLRNQSSDHNLQSISGIKVMAIIWVVIGNVYLVGYQPQLKSFIKSVGIEMSRRSGCLLFQPILNSWIAAQIFFLIGGLLMAYTTRDDLNRSNGRINLFRYVLRRLIRLTPPIVYTILLIFLMPLYLNGGPIYKSSTSQLFDSCVQNWWKSLLFITNWFEPNHTCLPHLWYISAYIQLSLIGIIVLLITYKRPKLFKFFTRILILIGIIFPMYMTYSKSLSAKSVFMNRPLLDEIPNEVKFKHFLTFNHFSAYFIGISIGNNATLEQSKHKLNIFLRLICWFVLPTISLISVVITYLWNDITNNPSLTLSVAYNGLYRVLYISGVAWVIRECVNNRGGLVNKLLSNKLLLPLSRLTYQIYLLNLLIVWFYYFTKRDLIIYRDLELFFIFCGVFVSTVIISIFGYLVFEAPFVNLSKRISNTNRKLISFETNSKNNPKAKSDVISITVENFEINGNTIKSNGLNVENFDSRL